MVHKSIREILDVLRYGKINHSILIAPIGANKRELDHIANLNKSYMRSTKHWNRKSTASDVHMKLNQNRKTKTKNTR